LHNIDHVVVLIYIKEMNNISMIAAYFEYLDLVQLEVKLRPRQPYLWKDLDGYGLECLLAHPFKHFPKAALSD
jgi:hypothetical protein